MILLVHMLFGVAIGALYQNFTYGIIAAFLSHYFLDLFPHIEYIKDVEGTIQKIRGTFNNKESIKNTSKVFADFLIGILLILFLTKANMHFFVFALVSILPDGATIIHSLFPSKASQKHHDIHTEKIQFLKYKKIPIFWQIFSQLFILAISVAILRFFI